YLGAVREPIALSGDLLITAATSSCRIYDLSRRPPAPAKKKKSKRKAPTDEWLGTPIAALSVPRPTVLLAAQGRVWGGGKGVVFAFDLPQGNAQPTVHWQARIDGTAAHLAVSEDRLYVSTGEGKLYAFGNERRRPTQRPLKVTPLPPAGAAQVA